MPSLEEFHQDFLQSILSDSESRGVLKSQSFFEIACEDLVSTGDLTGNYTTADYSKKGMEVSGFDYDEERKVLTILNHQFFQDDELQTLTKSVLENKLARLRKFYTSAVDGLFKNIEETSEAYGMAYNIYRYAQRDQVRRVRFIVLTDGKISRNLLDIPIEQKGGIDYESRVIDLEYLYKIYETASGSAGFEVEVNLPCLRVNDNRHDYFSYLTVVNGKTLVQVYEEFGQKLFEQNVRTFLQFKGNVNKGLRNTIEYKPEMFFAYNNGITATASDVELDEKTGNIRKIANFQIVNGGQTTSAIYAAFKNSGLSVDDVSVQMKLSVVKDARLQDEFISRVAEYANTQNKINNSDFFSNSPFHKDIKEYSTRIFAPAVGGAQRRTHWFYERVRGEYLNSQAYLKADVKRRFLIENPKNQVFDKTLLSKTENLWLQRPDIVSKGAQESFKKFAEYIGDLLEKDDLAITESFYNEAIARIILFRTMERIVSKAPWYDGGFRAQTVAYSISYLSAVVQASNVFLNFDLIWELQAVPAELESVLGIIAERVYATITHPASGYANIAQWTKNSNCWESVKLMNVDLPELDSSLFIDRQTSKYKQKESKNIKSIDQGIDKQIFVIQRSREDWRKLFNFYTARNGRRILSGMQLDMLEKMASGYITTPSEKQSKILYEIFRDAQSDGFDPS
ncbi:AIPR family protein [Dyadobacter arcticus]|uniref:AIPR protein n=1 Tax=Dyadobacter arcticus TaxID=1078754 RepID=A0ABX0ULH7_9BACT|nr:AIPR family protein [Dyadobacter arcticus]NIJ52310.1 hypothetical protein [Dyadobacter arcticus]